MKTLKQIKQDFRCYFKSMKTPDKGPYELQMVQLARAGRILSLMSELEKVEAERSET